MDLHERRYVVGFGQENRWENTLIHHQREGPYVSVCVFLVPLVRLLFQCLLLFIDPTIHLELVRERTDSGYRNNATGRHTDNDVFMHTLLNA